MARCSIYVGELPLDAKVWQINELFREYGSILNIKLKIPRRPPAYCVVEYRHRLEARNAISLNGYDFDGHRIRVELFRGGRRSLGAAYHSMFQVAVQGLPPSASWQEVKDHMREGGNVCFVDVDPRRDEPKCIVHYTNYRYMQNAIDLLDRTEFRDQSLRSYTIRVEPYDIRSQEEQNRRRNRRSRSPPARLSRSRSRSRQRLRSTVVLRPRSRS